jgi:hypothetical protein
MKNLLLRLSRIITAPFRFLIALDRNEIALNHDDAEYLKHKKSQL